MIGLDAETITAAPKEMSERARQLKKLELNPMKTKNIDLKKQEAEAKALLAEIQKKREISSQILNKDLPKAKATVASCLKQLAEIGVAEDYEATLLMIAGQLKEVPLPIIRKVLTEQPKLDAARNELGSKKYMDNDADGNPIERTGKGYLSEEDDGNRTLISITSEGEKALELIAAS